MISIRTKSRHAHRYMEWYLGYKIPMWPRDHIHFIFNPDFNKINSELDQAITYLDTNPFEVNIDVDETLQILDDIIKKLKKIKNENENRMYLFKTYRKL